MRRRTLDAHQDNRSPPQARCPPGHSTPARPLDAQGNSMRRIDARQATRCAEGHSMPTRTLDALRHNAPVTTICRPTGRHLQQSPHPPEPSAPGPPHRAKASGARGASRRRASRSARDNVATPTESELRRAAGPKARRRIRSVPQQRRTARVASKQQDAHRERSVQAARRTASSIRARRARERRS